MTRNSVRIRNVLIRSCASMMLFACGKKTNSQVSAGPTNAPIFVNVAPYESLFVVKAMYDSNAVDIPQNQVPQALLLESRKAIVQAISLYQKAFVTHSSNAAPIELTKIVVTALGRRALSVSVGAGGEVVKQSETQISSPAVYPAASNTTAPATNFNPANYPTGDTVSSPNLPIGFVMCNGDAEMPNSLPSGEGASAVANFQAVTSKYLLSFSFKDKGAPAPHGSNATDGREISIDLKDPIEISDFTKVRARSSLSVSALRLLQPALAGVVAQLFGDINVSLTGSACWSSNETLAPALFYRGSDKSRPTKLAADLSRDVVSELCNKALTTRNLDKSACRVTLEASSDPYSDLQKDAEKSSPVSPIRSCQSTELTSGMLGKPVYKLYISSSPFSARYTIGQQLKFYQRVEGGWQQESEGWFADTPEVAGEVIGNPAKVYCRGRNADDVCYVVQYAGFGLGEFCNAVADNASVNPRWALSSDTRDLILVQ